METAECEYEAAEREKKIKMFFHTPVRAHAFVLFRIHAKPFGR